MALTVAQLTARLTADTSNFFKAMSIADAAMFRTGGIAKRVGAGIGIAMIGGAVMSARAAGNFEESMNVLQEVSGATEDQFTALGDEAKALGKDVRIPNVSAKDAADAMLELAKAGLSVEDTLKGARGVLQLGVSSNLDFADSATVVARAMTAFGLKGDKATQVADLLTAAANKSTAEVGDMALGFQMAGTSFAGSNQSIVDMTASLALMANAGIAGSDAGTSLKQMMRRLTPQSKAAKDEMKKLGVEVFNAKGEFKPMREIIGEFTKATKNMSTEQRQAALGIIFGSDAIRAANVMLTKGTEKFDAMTESVTQGGEAQAMAEAKTKGLNGAVGGLVSQIETLAIEVGSAMLPTLTDLVRKFSDFVGSIDTDKIVQFGSYVKDAVKVLFELGKVLFAVATANGKALPMLIGIGTALVTLNYVIRPVIASIMAMRAAMMGLTMAMAINPVTAWTVAVGALAGLLFGFIGRTAGATTALNNLRQAMDDSAAAALDLSDAMVNISDGSLRVKAAQAQQAKAQAEVNRLEREGATSTRAYETAQDNLRAANNELTRAQTDLTRRVGEGTKEVLDAMVADRNMITTARNKRDEAARLAQQLPRNKKAQEDATKAQKEYEFALKTATSNSKDFTSQVQDIARNLKGPAKAAFLESAKSISNWNVSAAKERLSETLQKIGMSKEEADVAAQKVATGLSAGLGKISAEPAVQAARRAVQLAVAAAKETAKISSPSKLTADEVGHPFSEGIAVGIADGSTSVSEAVRSTMSKAAIRGSGAAKSGGAKIIQGYKSSVIRNLILTNESIDKKMKEGLRKAITGARATVTAQGSKLQVAFGRMRDRILRGFDAISAISTPLERALQGETAAEKELRELEEGRTATSQAERKSEADNTIAAIAGRIAAANSLQQGENETAEELAARKADELLRIESDRIEAQRVLDDIAYEQTRASLEKRAETERANLESAAELERKNWDERRLIQREALEDQLTALENNLMSGKIKSGNIQRAILKTIRSFDKGYKKSGELLGVEFAAGLVATRNKVVAKARLIAKAIENVLKLRSPAKEGPLSDLNTWWTPFSETLLEGIDTRPLSATVNGAVTPSPGALMGRGAGGAGAIVVNVSDQTFAGMSREQADRVARDIKAAFDRQVIATF